MSNINFGNKYVGYRSARLITPSDTEDFQASSALHIGVSGGAASTLHVLMQKPDENGNREITITGLLAGWHLLHVTRIFATGTDVSEILLVI